MYLTSRYSSTPNFPPSRPRPDCLKPPKGISAVDIALSLAPTSPTSSFSATRHIWAMSCE